MPDPARPDPARPGPARPGPKCPVCGRPREDRWRPFCSKRCADVDLGRWMTGRYAVPADEPPPEEEG